MGRGEPPAWLRDAGDHAVFHPCELTDPSQVETAARAVNEPLDLLINNAATFGGGAFYAQDFDLAALNEALAVNIVAPLLLSKLLKPRLLGGARKLIVMMSTGNASLAGNTTGDMLSYRCTKSALNQAVRTMAAEWAAEGLTTVALNPGWVRTDMGGGAAPLSAEDAAEQIVSFVVNIADRSLNGAFVNTDGSALPW